jgi:hypothetical protein
MIRCAFGVDGSLDVVADLATVPGLYRHRAGVRISERELPVRSIVQLAFDLAQPLDLLPDPPEALSDTRHLYLPCFSLLLSVDAHHLVQIARDACLQMLDVAGDLAFGVVPVPVVDRLELAAVNGHAIPLERADPAAKFHEPRIGPADTGAAVRPKVGNRLVIGDQPTGQLHNFHVARSFAFQPPARRDLVQVAVDEELEQDR